MVVLLNTSVHFVANNARNNIEAPLESSLGIRRVKNSPAPPAADGAFQQQNPFPREAFLEKSLTSASPAAATRIL